MRTAYPAKRQTGFTLVEIAIVLVIIGLLLGGILKGQEMITQARVKNVMNDFNGVTAAYFSYQDRYKAVPGDDGGAATRWTAPPLPTAAVNGNADGVIQGNYNSPTTTDESRNFWWHLRLAGFVPGATSGPTATQQPTNAVGGIVGIQTGGMGLNGLLVCSTNLLDKIAASVDTQLDDTRIDTGTLRGFLQVAGSPNPNVPGAPTPGPSYVEGGSNQYLICRAI